VSVFSSDKAVCVWWGLAALTFGIRVAAAIFAGGFDRPESFEYEYAARELVEGRGLTYPHLGITYYSYLPPLYAWICAGIYLLTGGSTSVVMLAQILVAAVHTVLVAAIAERFMGRSAGVFSGLLMAVHPGLIVYSSLKLHPLVFDAFFFTLMFWQFLRLREDSTLRRAGITGLIAGFGMLSRSTTAIFLPLGCLWLFAGSTRLDWPKLFGRCIVIGVCAAAVVAPWVARNALIHGQFVPFVTTDSEVFWRGNNPHATGHSYVNSEQTVLDTLSSDARAELRSLSTELEQSRWFRRRAVAFITANPEAFVHLTLDKFIQFWWFAPQTGIRYPDMWLRIYQVYYVLALVLAVVGFLAITRGDDSDGRLGAVLLVVFMIAIAVLQSFYYVEGRHRWGVEPFLLLLAGGGASQLIRLCANLRARAT